MEKYLKIKINSRKYDSEEYENNIIQSLVGIGMEYDGSDMDFCDEFNRGLFFFLNKDIDIEVIKLDDEEEDDDDDDGE